jgi:uncharacterized integral membrane protein
MASKKAVRVCRGSPAAESLQLTFATQATTSRSVIIFFIIIFIFVASNVESFFKKFLLFLRHLPEDFLPVKKIRQPGLPYKGCLFFIV